MEPETRRCFVALFPGRESAATLSRLARRVAADGVRCRFVRAEKLHVTLAFAGDLTADEMRRAASALLPCLEAPPVWTVTRLGVFSKVRVLYAAGDADGLRPLADEARRRLRGAGIPFDAKPFKAHVTLARDWTGGIPEFRIPQGIRIALGRPALYVSDLGRGTYAPFMAG